ncbi:MAG: putative motility protein [Oscillospiraceae bacterium]
MVNSISGAANGLATQKLLTDVALSLTKKSMDSQSSLAKSVIETAKNVQPAPKTGVGSRMNILA